MINLPLGKSTGSPIQFKAGTVFFSEGELTKYLFIIKKGQVGLYKKNGNHLTVIKNCSEQYILNEVSVLTDKPIGYSAIAKTDVEIVLVEKLDILSVFKKSPAWIPAIFATLCTRLQSTLEIIEEHNLISGEKNADTFLTKDEEIKLLNALSEYKAH